MIRTLRRAFVFSMGRGFQLVAAFLFFAWGTTFLVPGPAEADEDADKWKKVALSDVGVNQRLMALEALKKQGGTAATTALGHVAAAGDLSVATAACAQLGTLETSGSKAELKALLEDTNCNTNVRIAAASAIAEHWRDSGDVTYLESKCTGDDLAAHCTVLKSKVYGR